MKQVSTQKTGKLLGFTLIELSIVLVIIGLIVGGVLVGQDLIKAAEIRSTMSQYEKYNTAINTFRGKYNGLPGDINATQATAFGLFGMTDGGVVGTGDGNGLLETGAFNLNVPFGETVMFWRHLTDANLTDGSYGAGLTVANAQVPASPIAGDYLPPAKLGRGTSWLVGSSSGLNYYVLAGVTSLTGGATATATYTLAKGLTPIESYNIDTKLDDGMPNTGIVQARGSQATSASSPVFAALSTVASVNNATWTSATAPIAGDCMTTGSTGLSVTNTYARGTTPGNTPGCNLRLRFN